MWGCQALTRITCPSLLPTHTLSLISPSLSFFPITSDPAPANPESCSHLLWRNRKTSEKMTPQSGHNPLSCPKTKPTQSVVMQPVNGLALSYDWTVTGHRRGQPPPRGVQARRLYLRGCTTGSRKLRIFQRQSRKYIHKTRRECYRKARKRSWQLEIIFKIKN